MFWYLLVERVVYNLYHQYSLVEYLRCLQIFMIIIKYLEKLFSYKYFFISVGQILRRRIAGSTVVDTLYLGIKTNIQKVCIKPCSNNSEILLAIDFQSESKIYQLTKALLFPFSKFFF